MALPDSDVKVCNLALDLLKEKPIANLLAPQTEMESVCARWYDVVRTGAIQSRNWNFATKTKAIPSEALPVVTAYSKAYALPNDYLKLRAINDPKVSLNQYDYSIEQRQLLINMGESSLNIWYLFDQKDVTKFPPVFTLLLAGRMAATISYKVTAKPAIKKEIQEFVLMAEREALAFNGQERTPRRYESSKLVNIGLFPASLQQVAGEHTFDFTP